MFSSLRAQTAAIVVAGLLVSNLLGFWLYSRDRHETLQLADAFDIVERAAGVSRLLRDLPETWGQEIVAASDSRVFRVWTSDAPPFPQTSLRDDERALAASFRAQVPRIANNAFRIWYHESLPADLEVPARIETPAEPHVESNRWVLVIGIDHGNGNWLNFLGYVAPSASVLPAFLVMNLLIAFAGLGLLALWLVARVTAPLHQLAEAARHLGRNLRTTPLPEDGPREVTIAARAFNDMQRRLIRQIESRTTLLAAISHDLRTPITQMRLRTELRPVSQDRDKTLAALDEMNTIIGTFLDYARASNEGEPRIRIDLSSLVSSICDDFADMGHDIRCEPGNRILLSGKQIALKRALVNLIENALVHAGSAEVQVNSNPDWIVVTVQDRGPGIPADRIARAFEPYYRIETARPGRSQSVGLGLSIALMIVEDHGGHIRLENRPSGGLRVEVHLPHE